jgi:hypothetical protein
MAAEIELTDRSSQGRQPRRPLISPCLRSSWWWNNASPAAGVHGRRRVFMAAVCDAPMATSGGEASSRQQLQRTRSRRWWWQPEVPYGGALEQSGMESDQPRRLGVVESCSVAGGGSADWTRRLVCSRKRDEGHVCSYICRHVRPSLSPWRARAQLEAVAMLSQSRIGPSYKEGGKLTATRPNVAAWHIRTSDLIGLLTPSDWNK